MNTIGRKWPNVSLIAIREKLSMSNWNSFLTKCERDKDVIGLQKALYGIQADMSDLRKMGIDDTDLVNLFLRLQGSIEKTARAIFRKAYPEWMDNPSNDVGRKKKILRKHGINIKDEKEARANMMKAIDAKRKRDMAFNEFIKGASF